MIDSPSEGPILFWGGSNTATATMPDGDVVGSGSGTVPVVFDRCSSTFSARGRR